MGNTLKPAPPDRINTINIIKNGFDDLILKNKQLTDENQRLNEENTRYRLILKSRGIIFD
jgi:hypothetical protein